MIINNYYRFIFVHIPKAAGTSVMQSLEGIRGNNERWLAETKHETLAELYSNIGSRLSADDKQSGQSPEKYFSFCFVRNPWDRMSSFYRYLVEKRPRQEIDSISSFKDFLIQARDGVDWIQQLYSMKPQLDYFTLADGRMRIDFLGHFEFLEEDIGAVAQRIGCPIQLGHGNRSSNTNGDYRKSYDDEMVEIIASRFHEDIECFGYTFDAKPPARRCSDRLDGPRRTFVENED